MTDKEKLYDWVCRETKSDGRSFHFSEIKGNEPTYLQDISEQPVLEEYSIDTRTDIERYMDIYFDEELVGIRTECVKAVLKGIHEISAGIIKNSENKKVTGIREYIYNF